MSFKKKGFSLIELLIVIAIFSVLLLITTDRFIIGAVKSNNNYNQEIDLQSGVKSSMDNIKNILKKSVQVHLVGKEVYTPNMDLSKLDKDYKYIAFREDGGNRFLANLIYNKTSNQFDIIPLMAIDKQDNLNNTDINYYLKFYEDDPYYKEKMEKNSLTLTVEGKSKIKGLKDKEANIKDFKLKEDFILPNVNQILISRHLKGNINDITAIAYDDSIIVPKAKRSVSLVFIIDASASMKETLDGNYLFEYGNDEYYKTTIKYEQGNYYEGYYEGGPYTLDDIKKYSEWNGGNNSKYITRKTLVEYALNEVFFANLDKLAKERNVDLSSYMFTYNSGLQYSSVTNPKNNNKTEKYFYDLTTLEKLTQRYGPYYLGLGDTNLETIKTYVTDGLNMKFSKNDHNKWRNGRRIPHYNAATNTGWALLQGFEILQQLKEKDISDKEDRYLVLLTDGNPTVATYFYDKSNKQRYLSSRANYNTNANLDHSKNFTTADDGTMDTKTKNKPLEYIKAVTNDTPKDLYKATFIIGFGDIEKLKNLGLKTEGDKVVKNEKGEAVGEKGENIYSYILNTKGDGSKVTPYMVDSTESLEKTLKSISEAIGQDPKVFDGPDKMGK